MAVDKPIETMLVKLKGGTEARINRADFDPEVHTVSRVALGNAPKSTKTGAETLEDSGDEDESESAEETTTEDEDEVPAKKKTKKKKSAAEDE